MCNIYSFIFDGSCIITTTKKMYLLSTSRLCFFGQTSLCVKYNNTINILMLILDAYKMYLMLTVVYFICYEYMYNHKNKYLKHSILFNFLIQYKNT
jgi:hypothetical protein